MRMRPYIVLFCFVCFSCSHTGFRNERWRHDRQCGADAGAVEAGAASLEVCEQGIVYVYVYVYVYMYMYMYNLCVLLSSHGFF